MIAIYIVNIIINANSDEFDWEELAAQSINLVISLLLLFGKNTT